MSLRWKIALALGALAAAATLTVGAASYRSTRERVYAEVDRSLAEAIALVPVDRRGVVSVLPDRGVWSTYEAQVLGRDGSVRATTLPTVIEPSDAAVATVGTRATVIGNAWSQGTEYRVRTTGLPNGALQVARSLEETNRLLDSLRTRTILVVVMVTASAVLVGLLIAGGVTASLRRLTATAETVGATGRLDVDVPAKGRDEVGRLGSAFAGMLAALRRSRDDQQRLVQDAGHELRTPLTSLRTNLDVLRRYPDLSAEERNQIVDDLHAETEELVELVNELVAVASGAADDEPVETFSLGDAARELAERYERRTGREVRVEADRSLVRAQRAAVQRAISNLLDNARKFDASGGPIEVEVGNGTLLVLDRGPGIPEQERELIFERFHRAAEARTLPGSGLGLSIVRDVVERHGGRVLVEERAGGGAAVGFHLPVAPSWEPPVAVQGVEQERHHQ